MRSKESISKEIASTIIEQLGGAERLVMFLGANRFGHGDNSLYFNYEGSNKSNFVKIHLNGLDLYDMTFYKLDAIGEPTKVNELNNVYCFDLVELFENETGLYLHF